MPGMNREDFDLTVENNVITLRGERRFEKKEDTDNYHRVERAYGSFTRSFTLPNRCPAKAHPPIIEMVCSADFAKARRN